MAPLRVPRSGKYTAPHGAPVTGSLQSADLNQQLLGSHPGDRPHDALLQHCLEHCVRRFGPRAYPVGDLPVKIFEYVLTPACRRSSPFQIGNAPADDVFSFSASPNKRDHVVPAKSPFLKNTTSLSPIKDTEERRITRAVTTGNALVPGTPGNRTFSARNARHQIGGVDVQGIYPPSACVFVAK
ncbi:hypothetical protein VTK26DRAFT_8199 [Humicola hyalothermophila]